MLSLLQDWRTGQIVYARSGWEVAMRARPGIVLPGLMAAVALASSVRS